MSPDQIRAEAIKFFNIFSSNIEKLANLQARWHDEREYENFSEYQAVIRKMVPANYKFVKATKRPFGFIVEIAGKNMQFYLQNSGKYGIKMAK